MKPSVTLFYIVEPEKYQFMACHLLASIRTHLDADVTCIGYCPEHRMEEVHPSVFKAHELMNAEIRPMKTEGMWREAYPHGNKIIAALQPRETAFSAFLDSDILFVNPTPTESFLADGKVTCSVAASFTIADRKTFWDPIYAAFDMPKPDWKVKLGRSTWFSLPYFSSGFVAFPETGFPQVWYDTARRIDEMEEVPKRRPYLDQISLPIAMQIAGLTWQQLRDEQHYILGGKLRGQPLPEDVEINCVHYRHAEFLADVGLLPVARKMLKRQTGKSHVRRLTRG